VDYGQFVKKFDLPNGFAAPAELRFDDVVATRSRASTSETTWRATTAASGERS
jgi:hypothetical protein